MNRMDEKRTKTPEEIHRDMAAAMTAFTASVRRFGEQWSEFHRVVGAGRLPRAHK